MELEQATAKERALSVTCPGCGAGLTYEAGLAHMKCGFCEKEVSLPDKPVDGNSLEQGLDKLLESAALDEAPTQKVLACQKCGATTTVEGQRISGRCAFCASHLVEERDSETGRLRPTALIPFKVERDKATGMFREWTGGLWFRPNNLKQLAKVAGIEGVYTPFWTFDASAQSRWEAESGTYYYVGSGDKKERKVRWASVDGHHSGLYDDILICGSQGLSADLLRRVEPYNTQTGLVPYKPEYLSGWAAEQYRVGPRDGWVQGKEEMQEREKLQCENLVPGDIHRRLTVSTQLDEITWKHVLLPVWIAAYEYGGKSYRFLVNGETGQVSGEAPYSWWKIGGALMALFFAMLVFFHLINDDPRVTGMDLISKSLLFTAGLTGLGAFKYLVFSRNKMALQAREFYRWFQ